jgi:hypothetical protein
MTQARSAAVPTPDAAGTTTQDWVYLPSDNPGKYTQSQARSADDPGAGGS